MTQKGKAISLQLFSSIPVETSLPKCPVALGEFNYVVLLKQFGFAIKSGMEQRDAAIKMGALGATTLLFKDALLHDSEKSLLLSVYSINYK